MNPDQNGSTWGRISAASYVVHRLVDGGAAACGRGVAAFVVQLDEGPWRQCRHCTRDADAGRAQLAAAGAAQARADLATAGPMPADLAQRIGGLLIAAQQKRAM